MNKPTTTLAIVASLAAIMVTAPAVRAQGCDLGGTSQQTLRNPLIQGAQQTQPGQSAPEGQPPAIGDGSAPAGVNPGMTGPSTLLPYVPYTPGSNICGGGYMAPFSPETISAPGELGPSMYVPPPNSTPGADPGMIHGPRDFGPPPVSVVNINPGGGISGSAPESRWGGQTTADFGRYKNGRGTIKYDFGIENYGTRSECGRLGAQKPGAEPTVDQYGRRGSNRQGANARQTVCAQ